MGDTFHLVSNEMVQRGIGMTDDAGFCAPAPWKRRSTASRTIAIGTRGSRATDAYASTLGLPRVGGAGLRDPAGASRRGFLFEGNCTISRLLRAALWSMRTELGHAAEISRLTNLSIWGFK